MVSQEHKQINPEFSLESPVNRLNLSYLRYVVQNLVTLIVEKWKVIEREGYQKQDG